MSGTIPSLLPGGSGSGGCKKEGVIRNWTLGVGREKSIHVDVIYNHLIYGINIKAQEKARPLKSAIAEKARSASS